MTITRLLAIALALAQFGGADDRGASGKLHGRYAFSGQRDCLYTTGDFDQNGAVSLPPEGQFFRISAVDDGVTEFDGKGHTHQRGHSSSLNINAGPGSIPLSDSDFECDGTYRLDEGIVSSSRSCTFLNTAGPNRGHGGTVTGIEIQGRIVDGGRAVLQATSHPAVETQTQDTANGSVTYHRLCVRSGTSIRLDDGD